MVAIPASGLISKREWRVSGANPPARKSKASSRWWMSVLASAVVSLAAFLLYRTLSRYSLDQIVASVRAIPAERLGMAGLFAGASYLCLTGFDWLALRYVGRPLSYRLAALASFTSLSLGHNIGFAALSSGAVRYRFYSRWGLTTDQVAKLILFCGFTVGLGLTILGGSALLFRPELARDITGLQKPIVIALGVACLGLASAYVATAALHRRGQVIKVRTWSLYMPPLRLAVAQVIVGPLNFACVAACLHQALAAVTDVEYLGVASVYVIANVTSLITHVPGGLGVIESVVMFLLPGANLIGALIVFRFVYYLMPLAIGLPLFLATELLFRKRRCNSPLAEKALQQ